MVPGSYKLEVLTKIVPASRDVGQLVILVIKYETENSC